MEPTKRCTQCLRLLPIVEFYRHKRYKDGRRPECKDCHNLTKHAYLSSDEGRRKRQETLERYHKTDKNKQRVKRWTKARIELQKKATPSWSNLSAIAAVYAEAERLTVETGVKHEVHHIHPVMEFKELFVGLHVPWNLEILTSEEHAEAHIELKRQFGDALAQAKK